MILNIACTARWLVKYSRKNPPELSRKNRLMGLRDRKRRKNQGVGRGQETERERAAWRAGGHWAPKADALGAGPSAGGSAKGGLPFLGERARA